MIRSKPGNSRIFLFGLLALVAASLTLAGCLFGGDDEPQTAPEPPPASDDAEPQTQPASAQTDQPDEPQAVTTTDDARTGQQQQTQPQVAQAEQPPPTDQYIVQPGDTLANIAIAHDVRLDDLIELNNIQNPNLVRVGQILRIPSNEPAASTSAGTPGDRPSSGSDDAQAQAAQPADQVQTPTVTLPNTAVAIATPTSTSASQFAHPEPTRTTNTIPSPPANFLQYGAAALPWLHGRGGIDQILPLFNAWPMPPLVQGNDRIVLIDSNGDGNFSLTMIYTDPNSFGSAVPFSNFVIYDPVPGRADLYRIAYDHRLAYGRNVQGLQTLGDFDLTGDDIRDITLREVACAGDTCTSAFYVIQSSGDGYRTITGSDTLVDSVTAVDLADRTADGVRDIVVTGLDPDTGERFTFTFTVQADALVEISRVAQPG